MQEFLRQLKSDLGKVWYVIKKILVYGFFLVEVVAWDFIGEPAYKAISSLKIMDRFKEYVNSVDNRYALLIIFLSVFVLMEITSTYGLILIGSGAVFTGIGMYSMKLVLTVPAVAVWSSGKKPLLSFILIRWIYVLIIKLKRSQMYLKAKRQLRKIRDGIKQFKEEYLNGDGSTGFTDSIKSIYKDIRRNND